MDLFCRRITIDKYPWRQHLVQALGICIILVLLVAGQLPPALVLLSGFSMGLLVRWRAHDTQLILWFSLCCLVAAEAAAHYWVRIQTLHSSKEVAATLVAMAFAYVRVSNDQNSHLSGPKVVLFPKIFSACL